MLANVLLFLLSLLILVKSADYAVRYSERLAHALHLSEFVVSFFIVSVISISPETSVSVISALRGIPEFGLGVLLGGNVADLLLVFGIAALASSKGIRVKSEILRQNFFYLALLLFPIVLGFNGYLSRAEGAALILAGLFFYLTLSIESRMFRKKLNHQQPTFARDASIFILSLLILVASAYFTVEFGVAFANEMKLPPILVGLTMVSIGTCLPELLFSLKAIRAEHHELALGDVLGTVITDATIVLGLVAFISPFSFDPMVIYLTGIAMFLAGVLVIFFMRSEMVLSKREGLFLLLAYIAFLIAELVANGAA